MIRHTKKVLELKVLDKFGFNETLSNIPSIFTNHLIYYPTPKNLNYIWSFGSLAGIFFFLQIITGIFLAMHYIPNVELAFLSVEHIMRDVSFGWLLRYLHANGASMVFILLYLHLAKGLYYRSYSYSRIVLWFSGVFIFLLMMATAFVGYVLPWGQMSFWGATVITNLITAIPYIGEPIAFWLWGGFSVGNPTLNRFFSIHYLLPFLIIGLVFLHLAFLHEQGSTNSLGVSSSRDLIKFWPYFGIKDSFIFIFFFSIYGFILFFFPNDLGHTDNYIPANPLVTPAHIVPEWYFLPFYAILRAIPNKLGGVIAMLAAILIFLVLPLLSLISLQSVGSSLVVKSNTSHQIIKNFCGIKSLLVLKASRFNPLRKIIFWLFLVDLLFLGYIGGNLAEEPFITAGRIASISYFFLLLFLEIPFCLFKMSDRLPLIFFFILKKIKFFYNKYKK